MTCVNQLMNLKTVNNWSMNWPERYILGFFLMFACIGTVQKKKKKKNAAQQKICITWYRLKHRHLI